MAGPAMRSQRRSRILIGVLAVALAASLGLGFVLFRQSEHYYSQLNALRLDPLELGYFQGASTSAPGAPLVVFYGDSRAAEWPAPDVGRFEFANRGIPAQTSTQVLERFDADVRPLGPKVVLIQVGINDLKTIPLFSHDRTTIVTDCEKNIRRTVQKSTDLGATVILTTIFPVGDVPLQRRLVWSGDIAVAINEVNAFIRTQAGQHVIVLDAYAALADADGDIKPEYSRDTLHLAAAGYRRLNAELAPILEGLD
jgi:lysophospholipase L1-like esterase